MMLERWAESLLAATAPAHVIDLHAKDTLAALLAGLNTSDGKALMQLYGDRADVTDRAGVIAAIARLSESDDIHLPSCVTPGSVVIPVALALGYHPYTDEFGDAVSAGYAAGLS